MDCEQFRATWVLILNGTLSSLLACAPTLDQHFEQCESCQAWLSFTRATSEQIRSTEEVFAA